LPYCGTLLHPYSSIMTDPNPTSDSTTLTLGIAGFTYPDLYEPLALARLTQTFDDWFSERDHALARRLLEYRASRGEGMTPEDSSAVLTDSAPHLGAFVARLFRIEEAWSEQQAMIVDEDKTVLGFRNNFVEPLAKRYKGQNVADFD